MTRAAFIAAAVVTPSVAFTVVWLGIPYVLRALERWSVHRQLRQVTGAPRARKAGRVL